MKKNNKGFVVSAVLYPLLVLFLALIMGLLAMTDTRKRILDKMKLEISNSIFDEATCSCDTILNKLNYLIKNGVGGGGGGFASGLGNVSIKAYETGADIPTTGDINDIAVVTTVEITDYKITPYEPENPKEGAIWVRTTDSPRAHIVGSNITVPVLSARQYQNNSWISVPGYIYTSDATWVPLLYTSSYLYTEDLLNGADPVLYKGIVPIEISETGVITKADTSKAWYKYEDKKWANAALLKDPNSYQVGDVISESSILMYLVWIPRYKYQLFNTENASIKPTEIQIIFGDKSTAKVNGTKNGEWLTHPAFTFGTTELNGFWVAKFESTGSATALTSKPGLSSWRNINVLTMFNAARNMELAYSNNYGINPNEIDTHMMKNMEWGAMAYLSHSKYGTCSNGSCVEIIYNSNTSHYTGGSGSTTAWASTYVKQSTTHNRYGIYDTSGNSWEYVMGNMTNSTSTATSQYFYTSSSGFSSPPADKYIDYYLYDGSNTTYHRGKLGDATRETLMPLDNTIVPWSGRYAVFFNGSATWLARGACAENEAYTGIFAFHSYAGNASQYTSFRVVLSSE